MSTKPYQVDWNQNATSIEELNDKLNTLMWQVDEMFRILYDDSQTKGQVTNETNLQNIVRLTNTDTITYTGTFSLTNAGSNFTTIRWNGASAGTLSSIASGSSGQLIIIVNISSTATLAVTHGTGTDQFKIPGLGSITLNQWDTVLAIHDGVGWQVLSLSV